MFRPFLHLVFKTSIFLRISETCERFWALAHIKCIEAVQSLTDVPFSIDVRHTVIALLWKHFLTMQSTVRRPVPGCLRVTSMRYCSQSIYFYCSQGNLKSDLNTWGMFDCRSSGKAISASTMHWKLLVYMNRLYAPEP